MKTLFPYLLMTFCAVAHGDAAHRDGHIASLPEEVRWGPPSPKLPPGGQIAVLAGKPPVPGSQYVFRAKLPDGYSVPPHWHPSDENVTVLKGTFILGYGDRVEPEKMREYPAGSYVLLPKDMPHYNRIKGETILQFHGVGPYDIFYVNSEDYP